LEVEMSQDDLHEESIQRNQDILESAGETRQSGAHSINLKDTPVKDLVNEHLPSMAEHVIQYEYRKKSAYRVDGLIIGTGESDFTKGNIAYHFWYKGKRFQLIDVPGIEGDESRYANTVKEAVAKAHLVFFVNGTNKKPEKSTARKIHAYLGRGSRVCPLVNVRGSADAYEFEEDRVSLEQGGGDGALEQTVSVLEDVLGEDAMLEGHCVQGLLGFSALAYRSDLDTTTIHPDRHRDLVVQQKNYLKYFQAPGAMYEFSQINTVAEVLRDKIETFRYDIVESNKTKVRELIAEYIDVLEGELKAHNAFIEKIKPEFKKSRKAIEDALETYEGLTFKGRKNIVDKMFDGFIEEVDGIIKDEFGDKKTITARVEKTFGKYLEQAKAEMEGQENANIHDLQERLQEAMRRLIEDVERVEFQSNSGLGVSEKERFVQDASLGWNLGLGDLGSVVSSVGSFAVSGAMIGTVFPGFGTAIGGIIGGIVGALIFVAKMFMSKDKRIRKQQKEVREKINEKRDDSLKEVEDGVKELVGQVREEVNETVSFRIDKLQRNLEKPQSILEYQIGQMQDLWKKVEVMPHGTIQEI